jgi:cytochrome c oxidase assembly protein subunit 15
MPLDRLARYSIAMLRLTPASGKRQSETETAARAADSRAVEKFDGMRPAGAPVELLSPMIAAPLHHEGDLGYSRRQLREGVYDRVLHLLALLTALATFPLIFMGGLVTSHHAGMSVPDWPNSYHYNMFLFPPRLWIGGIMYEHKHRLMATVVGFLSLCLAVWAWRRELLGRPRLEQSQRTTQFLALAVLLGAIVQGVLGGLRVLLVSLDLAIVHACAAQAFFCLATLMTIVSSRWWSSASCVTFMFPAARRFIRFAGVCVLTIYLQLIIGATMRHHDAGLSIPDVPLAY